MSYRRYKLVISIPAISSIAVLVGGLLAGLLAILFYSLYVINGSLGNAFVISISLQTIIIYLVSLILCSLFVFAFLKRKGK